MQQAIGSPEIPPLRESTTLHYTDMVDPVWKILRWVAAFVGLFNAVISFRELLTRPDRDVWMEVFGSFVSLHSIYLGVGILATVVTVACAFPLVRWVWYIPERRREAARRKRERDQVKEQEQREQEQKEAANRTRRVIDGMERLQKLIREQLLFADLSNPGAFAENEATIRILKDDLIKIGLGFPEYAEEPGQDRGWLNHVSRLLPHIRRYGFDRTLEEFNAGSFYPVDDED